MDNKNSELLFEYLRSILYDDEVKQLDINSLDEPFQKLGLGLQYLERSVAEMKSYSEALAKGNLAIELPAKENTLCENLKSIHADLKHLTWQAKQVAKGDYSQKVSFLGEFSEAFNSMTERLEEREQFLKAEAEREKLHAQELEIEVYRDALTRIGNRLYFFEKLKELLPVEKRTVLCYCDLDNLKCVNDHFGHEEGDRYLRRFVKVVQKQIRFRDVFARIGGDEFCIILKDCPYEEAVNKVKHIQKLFARAYEKPYPVSFSCGIMELSEELASMEIKDIIKRADELMYIEKKKRKDCSAVLFSEQELVAKE